ncbi:hypothetical protein P9112_001864 [Eukaryota sp. TZLM1-RC]
MTEEELPELPESITALPSSDLPPTRSLVEFYRNRVLQLEQELSDARSLIQLANQSTDLSSEPPPLDETLSENLRLRKELFNKNEDIAFVKKQYRDSLLAALDERELLIKTVSENDRLRAKEMEDRVKIQQLLDLAAPLSRVPSRQTVKNTMKLTCDTSPLVESARQYEEDHLLKIYKERIELLDTERSELIDDYEGQISELKSQMTELFEFSQSKESQEKTNLNHYLTLKNEASVKIRNLIEDYEVLRDKLRKEAIHRRSIEAEVDFKISQTQIELEKSSEEINDKLRHELLKKDTHLTRSIVVLENEIEQLRNDNEKLSKMVNYYKTEAERADQRRIWAFEGFEADICNLRKMMTRSDVAEKNLIEEKIEGLESRLEDSRRVYGKKRRKLKRKVRKRAS